MTKLEMINEMMRDMNFSVSHKERIAKNCVKQPKWKIEEAYKNFKQGIDLNNNDTFKHIGVGERVPNTTPAQIRANAKYDKENTKQVLLKLNKTTDLDILNKLANETNVQGYIKSLIRKDIKVGKLPQN